jgi:hypothetical protein
MPVISHLLRFRYISSVNYFIIDETSVQPRLGSKNLVCKTVLYEVNVRFPLSQKKTRDILDTQHSAVLGNLKIGTNFVSSFVKKIEFINIEFFIIIFPYEP